MSKQQTALTIFFDKIRVRFDKDSEEYEQLVTDYVLAKELYRQQIIDANIGGMEFIAVDPDKYQEDAEQYYNNKYGK